MLCVRCCGVSVTHVQEGIIAFRNLSGLPDDVFYDINAVYLGRISYTDWIFGQLLDGIDDAGVTLHTDVWLAELTRAGMTDRTAVFMSSDHGDFAGDSHLVEKARVDRTTLGALTHAHVQWPGGLDDMLTHVPLMARIPGVCPTRPLPSLCSSLTCCRPFSSLPTSR